MLNANDKEAVKEVALLLTVNCVRNTIIEEYHEGEVPKSKIGDYSDVKVVTPYGEIPWNELSRISDDEMMAFNIEVVNRVYTFLLILFTKHYPANITQEYYESVFKFYPVDWNEPEEDEGILRKLKITN